MPSIIISPDVGFISPFKCCTNVDFPDPVCPINPINSPSFISISILFNAFFSNGVF